MPFQSSGSPSAHGQSGGALSPADEKVWLGLALALAALTGAMFLIPAFTAAPGVQDDARMFLSWMGRWDGPDILKGDLVADYWQSVTPPVYRGLFRIAWLVGIEPVAFVKILPALLYILVAAFSYRFLLAIDAEPVVAFVATAVLLFYLSQAKVIDNGAPRSMWLPFLLIVLDGLARKRIWLTALGQLLLAGSYPQAALVASSIIGLTLVAPSRPSWLDLTRRRLALVAACAVATIVGLLPFLLSTDRFGPVVTLAEALQIPTFVSGRNRITGRDGSISFVCGSRLGLFGNNCRGLLDPGFLARSALAVFCPLVLAVRAARRTAGVIRSPLPFLHLAMSLVWFVIAALVMFRLHLPSRYTTGLLAIGILTGVGLAVEWIGRRISPWLSPAGRVRPWLRAVAFAIPAFAIVLSSLDQRPVRSPPHPELIAAIRSLPEDAVVAGFVGELDFSPALTGRSTLFNRELTIGYQLGYLRPIMRRMEDMRDAVLTADAAALRDRLQRNGVDILLVEDETLAKATVPRQFRGFFGSELAALETQAREAGPTALAREAGRCAIATFDHIRMLDAACLTGN